MRYLTLPILMSLLPYNSKSDTFKIMPKPGNIQTYKHNKITNTMHEKHQP